MVDEGQPDEFAGLVMEDANGVGPFRRAVVGPGQMAREHIFRALMPFEADQRDGRQMRLASRDEGIMEGIRCDPRSRRRSALPMLELDAAEGVRPSDHGRDRVVAQNPRREPS